MSKKEKIELVRAFYDPELEVIDVRVKLVKGDPEKSKKISRAIDYHTRDLFKLYCKHEESKNG
jgi:hypothetical protein